MKPDGTSSFSTADEKLFPPRGNRVTEQEMIPGSEVEKCLHADCDTWSYLFVHHSKVRTMEEMLAADGIAHFVHKTIRYFQKQGKQKVQRREMPTVSGLVFFQGHPKGIQDYLNYHFPNLHLCKNCSTGKVAVIPDSQMRPFMRINQADPERIRFLLKPFHYYARNRVLLRISSGELAGLEGYVIRIDRDRRLVMDVGGISVAIAGVHAEHFEEVEQADAPDAGASPFYQRNLQEREALIDRYFHPVKSAEDVSAQADNICYLHRYVQEELAKDRMDVLKAWMTYSFIIREIAYYYAPFFEQFNEHLAPIMEVGAEILQEMELLISSPHTDSVARERFQADHQELVTKYGYLF